MSDVSNKEAIHWMKKQYSWHYGLKQCSKKQKKEKHELTW